MLTNWRPPIATASDVAFAGASGFTTLGRTSPAFDMFQSAQQAAGQAPVQTALGPQLAGGPLLAVGIAVLLLFAWYLDRRVL